MRIVKGLQLTTSFLASIETSSLNLLRQMRASRNAVTPSSLRVKLTTAMLATEKTDNDGASKLLLENWGNDEISSLCRIYKSLSTGYVREFNMAQYSA